MYDKDDTLKLECYDKDFLSKGKIKTIHNDETERKINFEF